MITGKDRKRYVAAVWRNVQLLAAVEVVKHETASLMQYGALVALAHAQGNDLLPIMEGAKDKLPPAAFDVLRRFAAKLG